MKKKNVILSLQRTREYDVVVEREGSTPHLSIGTRRQTLCELEGSLTLEPILLRRRSLRLKEKKE